MRGTIKALPPITSRRVSFVRVDENKLDVSPRGRNGDGDKMINCDAEMQWTRVECQNGLFYKLYNIPLRLPGQNVNLTGSSDNIMYNTQMYYVWTASELGIIKAAYSLFSSYTSGFFFSSKRIARKHSGTTIFWPQSHPNYIAFYIANGFLRFYRMTFFLPKIGSSVIAGILIAAYTAKNSPNVNFSTLLPMVLKTIISKFLYDFEPNDDII